MHSNERRSVKLLASRTIRNIVGMEVVGCTAKVEKNKITSYKAKIKIAFIAERP